ncbi:hypothetical protein HB364_08165 [Pseudoflavitalea sp. X16]|uniref:hypothetical protein n=1 Tax=Paraflavitalea devenefica TaxID=2716334 RepID=UPI001420A5AE|nr:hypothetical protein [Paraflavitalea devenefica]NII25049.1 hypothetical protein [Paraflavitalea devenefica]
MYTLSVKRCCTFLFVLITLLPIFAFSQDGDEAEQRLILNLDVFADSTEKRLFTELLAQKNVDYFRLMLLAGNTKRNNTAVKELADKLESFIQSKNLSGNKTYTSKELKKLYKEIHDAFLGQYVDNPAFSEIFDNGKYNCATASALYALLLGKLAIEYDIHETPDHVYIVAAPTSHNVIFETTAPGATAWQLNDKSRQQFVEYLYNNKIISKEEWTNGNQDELFKKHFYNDKAIGLRELTGLLYYNMGVAATQEENYEKAYRYFERAYFLYPDKKIKYFISITLASFILKSEENGEAEEKVFPGYIRYMQVGNVKLAKEMIGDYMKGATKKYLFQHPDRSRYLQIYNTVMQHVKDSALVYDLQYDHYYNSAHYFSIKERSDSSRAFLDLLYNLNRNDLLIQELITGTIRELVSKMGAEKTVIDSLKSYFATYPFLKKTNKLQEYYIFCLATQVGMLYDEENDKEGIRYLTLLKETLQQEKPALDMQNKMLLTNAIGEVSGFYVRKSNYKSARELLVFMKNLYPDNEDFARRLTHVEKMLNTKK